MGRSGNPTINVGLAINTDEYIANLKKSLKSLSQQGVDLGLADAVQDEIKEINKMLDGLQKTMKNVSGTKLSSSTFNRFQKEVGAQIEALDKRTTALETGMETLMKTMSTADGGKFKSMMDEIRRSMQDTLKVTSEVTDAIGTVVKAANTNASINIVNKQQIDELKESVELLKTIKQIEGRSDITNADKARNSLVKFIKTYSDLQNQLNTKTKNTSQYDAIQSEIAQTIYAIKELQANIDASFEKAADRKKIFSEPIDDLKKSPMAILKAIDQSINTTISALSVRIKELTPLVGQALDKAVGDVEDKGRGKGFTVPVGISTTEGQLRDKVIKLIENVRPLLAGHNIDVGISLVTDWGNRKQRELFKEFQSKVGSIIETTDSAEIKAIYDDITKYFNDEINIKIKSDIHEEKEKILADIAEIRAKIKEEPLSLDVNQDKEQKSKKIYDQSILNGLDALASKLKDIHKTSEVTKNDLEVIGDILSSLKFPGVSENIAELDKAFASLQKTLSTVANRKTEKNRQIVQDALKGFKEYQAAGGQRGFEELTNNKNIQKWFKQHINDSIKLDGSQYQKAGQQIGKDYAIGIRESIDDVIKACEELVYSGLSTIALAQDSNSPAKKTRKLGNDFGQGYVEGIRDQIGEVDKIAEDLVNSGLKSASQHGVDRVADMYAEAVKSAEAETANAQQSHQPSKVAEKLGEYWGEGYANGILNTKGKVKNAIRALVEEGKLTLKDLSEDSAHTNESDQVYLDLINKKNPPKIVQSYQNRIKKVSSNPEIVEIENKKNKIIELQKVMEDYTNSLQEFEKKANGNSKKYNQYVSDYLKKNEINPKYIYSQIQQLEHEISLLEEEARAKAKVAQEEKKESEAQAKWFNEKKNTLSLNNDSIASDAKNKIQDTKQELRDFLDNLPKVSKEIAKSIDSTLDRLTDEVSDGTITAKQALEELNTEIATKKIVSEQNVIQAELEETEQKAKNVQETFIHLGSENIDSKKFVPIKNNENTSVNKPSGGFWGATTNSADEWAFIAENDLGKSADYLAQKFAFRFKDSANVLVIKSLEDIEKLPRNLSVTDIDGKKATSGKDSHGNILPDWEKISKEYDGIVVKLTETEENLYEALYGWDIDSVVVTNPDAIEKVELETKAVISDAKAQRDLADAKKEVSRQSSETPNLSKAQDEVQKFLAQIELIKDSKVYNGIDNVEEKIAEFSESVHDGMYSAEEAFHAFTESSSFDPDARVADLEKEKQQAEETAQAEEELANSRKKADSVQDKMSDEQLDMYAQWAEDADKVDGSLEETIPVVDKMSEGFQETTSTVDKLLERLEQLPATVQAGLNAIDSSHWKGLDKIAQVGTHEDFRRGKNKYSEKQVADATNLLKLAGSFQQTGSTEYLKELYKSINTSEVSSRMKNALKGRIWQIVKDIEKGAEQAVEETVKEEVPKKSTKMVEMTKGKYKEYVRQSGLIADNESFDHNFDLHLQGLEKKGLAEQAITKSGKKGKWKIQVEVEVDDHALELTEKELQELNQQEREFVNEIHSSMSDADIKNDLKRAEAIERLATGFEKLKTLIGKEGNFNLRQDGAKDRLSTYVDQYIKYKSQGGISKLNDLTDNPKVLQKLQKEYERQIDLRKQKIQVTKEEASEETKVAKASEQNAKVKSKSAMADEKLVNAQKKKTQQTKETTKEIQNQVKAEQDLNKVKSNQSKKDSPAESANSIKKEADALDVVEHSAKVAAQSKESFSEANKEVLQSIISSLNGLNNEGKAFENLHKLINNLGGKNGDAKLQATVDGLREIVKVLSYPLDGNSFIDTLEKIASSGSSLGDIATILKASNKNLLEAADTLNKVSGIDLDDILNTKPQDILDNARLKLLELGGNDSQLVNISDINKTKDGFLEIVGVIKTADDQLQEFTLHTKDGIEMQNVGMNENTARLAKQMKMYSQVEQYFKRMQNEGQNVADGAFFNPDVDPETWKVLLSYAEEYREYLGDIQNITMQTRQGSSGELLESFSFNGSNGNHVTFGRNGNVVASSQDVFGSEATIKKIKELYQERKRYNDLIQKRLDNTATAQELSDLDKLDQKYAEVTSSVERFNNTFGNNEAARQLEKLNASLTSDFNASVVKFAENASNKITNALTTKNNQATAFVTEFREEIQLAQSNIEELFDVIKNHPADTPWSDEERLAIQEMAGQIDKVTSGIKDLENTYQKVGDVDKLISKISKDLNDNTAMSGGLKARYNQLRDEIKALRGDANLTEDSISQIDKITFQQLTNQFNRLHAEMLETQQTGDSFFKSLTKAAQSRTIQFLARYLSFYDIVRYSRQAIGTIQELDTALVDLRKTTTMSNDELNEFYNNSTNIAREMGVTTKEIIDQASSWSRLGYSSKEASEEMAALSSQFAAISPGMSTEQAQEGLVSIMKAWDIDVEQVERRIMDNINVLGNKFAETNLDVIEGMERSAATLSAIGMNETDSFALFTGAQEVLQNAETVGTALKTLSLRIRGYDEETEELSQDVIEATGKVADLTKVASNNYAGVSLWADAEQTKYRSLVDYLGDISEIWDEIDAKSQTDLLDKLFGKRGASAGSAILLNFDQVRKALVEMEGAAGAADDEMAIIRDSIEYKLNELKQTWVGFLKDMIDRGVIADLIDKLIELSDALIKVIEINPKGFLLFVSALVGLNKAGGFKGITDTISGLGNLTKGIGDFAKLAKGTKEVATATAEVSEVLLEGGSAGLEMAQGMATAEVAMEGAGGAATVAAGKVGGLSGAASALAGALGISVGALAAFAALAVAVGVGAVVAWDKFTITVEEAEEAVRKSEGKVSDLKQKVEELEAVENRTGGQEKRLELLRKQLKTAEDYLEVQKQIEYSERFGNKFSDSFDKENAYTQYKDDLGGRSTTDINQVSHGSYQGEAEDRISYINKYLEDLEKAKEGSDEASEAAKKLDDEQDKARETLAGYLEETERYYERLNFVKESIESGYLKEGSQEYKNAQEMIKGYTQIIGQNEHWIELLQKAVGDYDYVQDDIKQLASKWETGSISSEYIANELIDHMDGFSEAEKAAFYNAIKDAKSWIEVLDILAHKQEEVNEKTSELNPNSFNKEAALAKYDIDPTAFEKYLEVFKELNPELAKNEDLCAEAAVAQYALDQAVEDLRSHLNDYVESLETLDETSIEYANSIQSLASDLSALTGIDFSITDAQTFMQDKANLDLLRDALDGDNAALDRLRANASRTIVANIVADTQIDTNEFWQQYNELVNWIIANPDIGTLEAKSYLDESPFVQSCLRMIAQGKMTAEQLQAIFAAQGWDFKYDTKKVDVWLSGGSVPKNSTGMAGDLGIGAGAGKYSLHKETITVPTNIRYERKNSSRTAPTISKPTSSSGSNYRPEQKSGSGGGGGGGSSKDPTEEAKKEEEELEDTYDEFFDYFERRLKVVSDAISLLDAHLENVVGSNSKNTLLDAQMRIYKMQQQEYADAQNMYQEMADRALAKIEDSNIVEKIKNGAVGIDEFIGKGNEEVVNAINDYTKWADKVADCKQQLAELKETIRQLELTRMKNILQDWQDVFDLRQDNAIDLIDKQISLIEESGNLVGKAFYEQQKRQTEGQLSAMEQAKRELSAELNRGLANGSIEVGTDEWIEEVGLLQEVESNILDCKQAIEEYDNAILAIHTDTFERLIDKLDDLDDELSDIAAFFDDEKVGDKFGNWSEAGQAQAGLLAQQYELAQNKVKKYAEQIDWLNGQYNAGKYSTTEYTEQLAELMDAMRESAKDAESAKEAMLDLNKARVDIVIDGINEEIEAYSDLISKEKDALSAEKDLHDYRKQIAESNKSIVAIQKQLAAIENDNSQKARAQRAKLQQQLKDAQDALAEQEYDHSVEMQQQALDEQLEQYKDTRQKEIDELNAYVENSQQVLTDMFENVRANAESIGQTIVQTAQEHGFQVSTSLTESWKAGENAIASYGAVLTPATSEFIAQLENVEQQTWDLQDQADKTAVSLADMFGTRADTLVGELQRSWQAEANAQAMADALRQSMVYALESGYDISSVVSSLNSVANAAKDVAEAANDAAGALDNAISKQNAFNNMPKSSDLTHYTTIYNNPNANQVNWDYIGGHTSLNSSKSSNSYSTIIPGLSKKTKKHARGLSKAEQDELAWTQELGSEFIVSPTRNSILTPIKAGDAVIDAKGTRNLFELAKIDPNDILQGSGAKVVAPQIESTNNSVSIGNLVNVEGSISSENLDAVKATIQSELKKTFRNINSGLRR